MKKNYIIAVIFLLVAGGGYYIFYKNPVVSNQEPGEASATVQGPEEEAVRALITKFSEKLPLVVTSRAADDVLKSAEENYGFLISEELLKGWRINPSSTPGRSEANTVPKGFQLAGLAWDPEDRAYNAQGVVAEIGPNGSQVSEYNLVLKIRKVWGRWVITGATKMSALSL